jgi:hypothetical protein
MKTKLAKLLVALTMVGTGYAPMRANGTTDASLLKGNVRYSVRTEYSRLLLLFRGRVHSTGELQANSLTVRVTGIQSAATMNGTSLSFHTGLIERAVVDRIVNGQTTIRLTLREGFQGYQIFSHDMHEAIWIDIVPNRPVITANARTAEHATARGVRRKRAFQSSTKSPIVDIPGMIREQLANGDKRRQSAEQPGASLRDGVRKGASHGRSNEKSAAGPSLLFLIASFSLVIAGILGMVSLASHKKKIVSKQTQISMDDQTAGTLPLFPDYVAVTPSIPERKSRAAADSRELDWHEEDTDNNLKSERAVTLAQQYHRNQGDIEFAIKMREMPKQDKTVKRGGKKPSKLVITSSKATAARKLGVGTGELELAERLKIMESATEKEEVA